jgi:hypothetical protein
MGGLLTGLMERCGRPVRKCAVDERRGMVRKHRGSLLRGRCGGEHLEPLSTRGARVSRNAARGGQAAVGQVSA